jgi:hypothetical protein
MEIQSDSNRRDIEIGQQVRALVNSGAWKVIHDLMIEKVESIKMKMDHSDDPHVVMSCVRHSDGIMFVEEVIRDLIDRGDEAVHQAAN